MVWPTLGSRTAKEQEQNRVIGYRVGVIMVRVRITGVRTGQG